MLLINADDWGRCEQSTDRIFNCYVHGKIQSASAMVFMSDSQRAAEVALKEDLPLGLHLNLTEAFTGQNVSEKLRKHHSVVAGYLRRRRFNQVLFNPMIHDSLHYIFQNQWEEFWRLYKEQPKRLDGHHHMHLCMNMLWSGKLPRGIKLRRNFTFFRGEKNSFNRLYRYCVDRWLQSRFSCLDYFFSLAPINQEKLRSIIILSRSFDVEIMVHPGVEEEYGFLMSSEWSDIVSEASVYHEAT